jgi:hypothetical protein
MILHDELSLGFWISLGRAGLVFLERKGIPFKPVCHPRKREFRPKKTLGFFDGRLGRGHIALGE